MNVFKIISLFSAVTAILAQVIAAHEECIDSEIFRIPVSRHSNKKRSCRWIGRTQKRRNKWCKKTNFRTGRKVKHACDMSCGECCGDDPNFKFKVDGTWKTCQWLQNKKKRDNWCDKRNNFGIRVGDACRVKCG